jgi:hypothetical protein
MVCVDIYRRLDIVGNRQADTWLRHGFMSQACVEVCESLTRSGRRDVAGLIDNRQLSCDVGRALFREIPPRYRLEAAGIRAGGGRQEVRREIDAWLVGVKEVLEVYALRAGSVAMHPKLPGTFAWDYMGPFCDRQYIPLWGVERGVLCARH